MKKTKKIRYKRYVKAEDAYISTDGVVKRKELKDTYTDKEQRELYRKEALNSCSLYAQSSMADIQMAINKYRNGELTFEQTIGLVAIAKENYLKNIEEGMWHEYLTKFDIEAIWKNKCDYIKKMYQRGETKNDK